MPELVVQPKNSLPFSAQPAWLESDAEIGTTDAISAIVPDWAILRAQSNVFARTIVQGKRPLAELSGKQKLAVLKAGIAGLDGIVGAVEFAQVCEATHRQAMHVRLAGF